MDIKRGYDVIVSVSKILCCQFGADNNRPNDDEFFAVGCCCGCEARVLDWGKLTSISVSNIVVVPFHSPAQHSHTILFEIIENISH